MTIDTRYNIKTNNINILEFKGISVVLVQAYQTGHYNLSILEFKVTFQVLYKEKWRYYNLSILEKIINSLYLNCIQYIKIGIKEDKYVKDNRKHPIN